MLDINIDSVHAVDQMAERVAVDFRVWGLNSPKDRIVCASISQSNMWQYMTT